MNTEGRCYHPPKAINEFRKNSRLRPSARTTLSERSHDCSRLPAQTLYIGCRVCQRSPATSRLSCHLPHLPLSISGHAFGYSAHCCYCFTLAYPQVLLTRMEQLHCTTHSHIYLALWRVYLQADIVHYFGKVTVPCLMPVHSNHISL